MISVFDLFKIGIGPSSSHTMGPMKAAAAFMSALDERERIGLRRLKVTLLGSLAWTGKGHRTDKAVVLGLSGLSPESLDPDDADRRVDVIAATRQLVLADGTTIGFDPVRDMIFDFEELASVHPNTIRFAALDQDGRDRCRPAGGVGDPQSAAIDPGDGLCRHVRDRCPIAERT